MLPYFRGVTDLTCTVLYCIAQCCGRMLCLVGRYGGWSVSVRKPQDGYDSQDSQGGREERGDYS